MTGDTTGNQMPQSEVQPVAVGRVAVGHGKFFQGLDGGVERGDIVAIGRAYVISTKDRQEDAELALVDEGCH